MPTIRLKLLFALYYLKGYPTFDVFGAQFGMARSKSCENLHFLYPILEQALVNLGVFPQRKFETLEEFRSACQNIETLLIDAAATPSPGGERETKRIVHRKKRNHAIKNCGTSCSHNPIQEQLHKNPGQVINSRDW